MAYVDSICAEVARLGLDAELRLEADYAAPGGLTKPYLDLRSVYFDPARALYSCTSLPPVPCAKPADCLHRISVPISCKAASKT